MLHEPLTGKEARAISGAFAELCPPMPTTLAILTNAICELNSDPRALTDADMARALQRILARRGLVIREVGRG